MNTHARIVRGFTLIELLVVIAIIGILAAVVLASLNTARIKARDARRASDMSQVQLALEMHYDATGRYPNPVEGSGSWFLEDVTGLAPAYIPALPQDPSYSANSNDYRYHTTDTARGYTLLRRHEGENRWCRVVAGGNTTWASISGTPTPLCAEI